MKDGEIIRVPSLFGTADIQFGDSSKGGFESPIIAQVSAAINGVVLGPDHYLSTQRGGRAYAYSSSRTAGRSLSQRGDRVRVERCRPAATPGLAAYAMP